MLLENQIAANERNTYLLVGLITLLLVALGAVVGYLIETPIAGIVIALVVAVGVSVATYYGGGDMILNFSHARSIEKSDHPQLFNVVEELSIAAGVPMPRVYVIDDESPNAFATGRDPEHAAVAITTGLLEKLDRDELQGVMAHELAHVRNRDILLSMMVGVLAGTIVLVADAVTRSLFWSRGGRAARGGRDKGAGGAVLIVIGIVLAILAPLFARMIQFSVSRQREYLADASAVELTRYPEGLASALEKLGSDAGELEAANRATAHLYIVSPFKAKRRAEMNSVFDTHPPLDERIKRLRAMT